MARAVYSTCFMAVTTGTSSASYTVPTGSVAVLHNMTFWNAVTQPTPIISAGFDVALESALMYIWTLEGSGLLRGTYQWSGREVFYDVLLFNTVIPGYVFRANGYLLTPT